MTRKLIFLIITLLSFCNLSLQAGPHPPLGGGNGSSTTPYLIKSEQDLAALANYVATDSEGGNLTYGKHYKLERDLDLSGYPNWTPIGVGSINSQKFQGFFDGNCKVVRNLKITSKTVGDLTKCVGLFGYTATASIKNLGVENCNINVPTYSYVGGLVGFAATSDIIENCYATGSVIGDGFGYGYIGGLIGYGNGSFVSNCYSTCNVGGTREVGGLMGYNTSGAGKISNCYATGRVSASGNNPRSVGGLIGGNQVTIEHCYASGNVVVNNVSSTSYGFGGLVGENQPNGTIRNCVAANDSVYCTPAINHPTPAFSGSINRVVGYNNGTINNNYANRNMVVLNGTTPKPHTNSPNSESGFPEWMADLKTLNFYATNPPHSPTPPNNRWTAVWNMGTSPNTNIWIINDGVSLPALQINCEKIILTASADITKGTISDPGNTEISKGGSKTYTFTPKPCYQIDTVFVSHKPTTNYSVVAGTGSYTFNNVQENDTIHVTFKKTQYTVIASAGANGSITPSGAVKIDCDSVTTFILTPDACYQIDTLFVSNKKTTPDSVSALGVGYYTFKNIIKNDTIRVTFKETQYTIMASASAGGNIIPSGAVKIDCNGNATFTFTPDNCYKIDTLFDNNKPTIPDSVSASGVGYYTFKNVQKNETIHIKFTLHSANLQNEALTICEAELPLHWRDTIFDVGTTSNTFIFNRKNVSGCDSIVTFKLTVVQDIKVDIIPINDNFCEQEFIVLRAVSNGNTFLWNTGSRDAQITVTASGDYFVIVSTNACRDTAYYTVEECPVIPDTCSSIFIPNIFTPNGDGINDSFSPVTSCNLNSFSMYIYNRWGKLVYKSETLDDCWDGKSNGKPAAVGVYYYVIYYSTATTPSKTIHGSVTLIR